MFKTRIYTRIYYSFKKVTTCIESEKIYIIITLKKYKYINAYVNIKKTECNVTEKKIKEIFIAFFVRSPVFYFFK
jgi:hypothetical protein